MRHHSDNDPHDALNDYLDAHTGFAPADSRAGDLGSDVRDGVERFLDLAERAGAIPEAHHQSRRPAMNATLPASGAISAPSRSHKKKRRSITMPAWTRHLHMLSTGLLILAVVALSFAAFGPNGIGEGDSNDTGDGPGLFSAVPVATVPPDTETSSIPYPGPEECTVEVGREELIEDIQEANVASEPELQLYERSIEPTDGDAEAILQTFREWQACSWDTQGFGFAYQMQLETPWFTANQLALFYDYNEGDIDRPVSEDEIEAYADVLLQPEEAATPPVVFGTPPHLPEEEMPELIPIPDGATPVVYEGGGGGPPTIFAEDIAIIGPNTATAQAYFVNPETQEVMVTSPLRFTFMYVDGQWLLHEYSEGGQG